jgi:hypothetical protein
MSVLISLSRRFRWASSFFLASWSRLIFWDFFSCFLACGNGFTWFGCQELGTLLDSAMKCSVRSNNWSIRRSSVRSLGNVDVSRILKTWCRYSGCTWYGSFSDPNDPGLPSISIDSPPMGFVPWLRRLLMWIINHCWRSIFEASHHTHCVTMIYPLPRAKAIIFSKLYIITLLLFSEVIIIGWLEYS